MRYKKGDIVDFDITNVTEKIIEKTKRNAEIIKIAFRTTKLTENISMQSLMHGQTDSGRDCFGRFTIFAETKT